MKITPKRIYDCYSDEYRIVQFIVPEGQLSKRWSRWYVDCYYQEGFAFAVKFYRKKDYDEFLNQFEQDPDYFGDTANQFLQWKREKPNRWHLRNHKGNFLKRKKDQLMKESKKYGSIKEIPLKKYLSINYKYNLICNLEKNLCIS